MTRKLFTLTALATTIALGAGCSSVRNDTAESTPTAAVGSYGSASASGTTVQDATVQYGHVREIRQLETSKRPSGAGALLGAVVGGVAGNQIGSGSGRSAATAIGAVGGAIAGNKIEEARSAPQTYYQVEVALDNGEVRSFDYADLNGLRVGDRVRVQDGQLQRW